MTYTSEHVQIYTFVEAYCSVQKCEFILCMYAINHVFSLLYILAINISLMHVVICRYLCKDSFFRLQSLYHVLGKLERAFRQESLIEIESVPQAGISISVQESRVPT